MTVSAAGTTMRPAIIGEVVDMPDADTYIVRDDRTGQIFYVHSDEVYWQAVRD